MTVLLLGRSALLLPRGDDVQTVRQRGISRVLGYHEPVESVEHPTGDLTPSAPSTGADAPGDACDLNDCSCTGRNIGKFTSPAALLAIAEAGQISGYDIAERLRSHAVWAARPDPTWVASTARSGGWSGTTS